MNYKKILHAFYDFIDNINRLLPQQEIRVHELVFSTQSILPSL
jgi:hypothetical protein